MKNQNISRLIEKISPKTLSIIIRGVLGGIAGGIVAGMGVGVIDGIFQVFYDAHQYSHWSLNLLVPHLIYSSFLGTIKRIIVWMGIPFGLVIGISTGILAVTFGHHCSKPPMWLALSGIGVITGYSLGTFHFLGWLSYVPLGMIAFVSLAASWMAYKSTIQEIKKDVTKEVLLEYIILSSQEISKDVTREVLLAYAILSSLGNSLLIFIMSYLYAYLISRSS